jgi:Domain of unknown function (DUF5666)
MKSFFSSVKSSFTLSDQRQSLPTLRGAVATAGIGMLIMSTSLFIGCEGGGDSKTGGGGTGTIPPVNTPPPTTLTASGPATSFLQLGLAGYTLDEATATVQINTGANRKATELRLGMTIDINGQIPVANSTQGTAASIAAQSIVRAPVRAIDAATLRISVLSLIVQLDQNTILDGFASINDLKAGDRIEVYGLPKTLANEFLATRVIVNRNAAITDPLELVGVASSVTATQFQLQGLTVNGATVSNVQLIGGGATTTLADGNRVRVIGTLGAANSITLSQMFASPLPTRADNTLIALDGPVQSLVAGAPGNVVVNEVQVDTTALPSSVTTALVPGTRVQLRSIKTTGVAKATDGKVITATERIPYQFEGTISEFTSRALFKVRGETVNASTATFANGTATDLAVGKKVRIKAVAGAGLLDASDVAIVAN